MKRSEIFLMVFQIPLDYFMLVLAGIVSYKLRFTDWAVNLKPVIFQLSLSEFINIIAFVALAWILIFIVSGLYNIDPNKKMSDTLVRIFMACSSGIAVVAIYIMFTQQLFDSRFLVATAWVFSILFIFASHLLMRGVKAVLYRRGIGLRRIVVVGKNGLSDQIIESLNKRKELGYNVISNFEHFAEDVISKLKKLKPEELIFINPRANEEESLKALQFCDENHIVFKYSADLFATYSTNMAVHPLVGVPIVEIKKTSLEGWGRVVKRIFDIILGGLVIVLVSPLMLLSALVILIETGRPIIYKNERVGIRGHKITVYKFRSMFQKDCTGRQFEGAKIAEKKEQALIKSNNSKQGPIYKIANDPRITSFGQFIRRFSIDELPQFFNVLKGDMSIVGPRPHQPREVDNYEGRYKKVLTLKPGITGLAQISGRSDLSFEEEMKLDIFYIEKWSLILDLIIFIKTPFVLFRKRKVL